MGRGEKVSSNFSVHGLMQTTVRRLLNKVLPRSLSEIAFPAIVWCLEPPIARFGSLILKAATDGFGYCFPRLSHLSSKFILLISSSLLNGFAPFNL